MAQKRLRMRGVKRSSKRMEDELLERSRALIDDPGILRPQCAGSCRKCIFDKTFKAIDSLRKISGNPDALIKEASRFGGDDIVRAYAGTISLAAAGSVPLLGTATLGGEKVSYAVRGTVGADKLIGCQYYTDPKIRLLLYNQLIKKHKMHLYSFGDDLVCSDKPNMPEDYLYDTFWETPYEFKDDEIRCGHSTSAVLEIHVRSLDKSISICDGCAKDVSTIQYVISRLAAVDPMDDIEVRVRHKYHAEGGQNTFAVDGDLLKKYMSGELNDATLISHVKRNVLGNLKEGAEAAYIIGTENYGSSLDRFIGDLDGSEREKETLRKFLSENNRAVVVKSNRISEVYSSLWDLDWEELIRIHTDAETVGKMGNQAKNQPLTVLENAYSIFISADVVASLPEFRKPGPLTDLSDKLAKSAKVGGENLLLKTIQNTSLKDGTMRCIASAFLLAMGSEDIPIKLSKEERDFAKYLEPFAKQVIAASGDRYRDDMNTLLTASSSGERV